MRLPVRCVDIMSLEISCFEIMRPAFGPDVLMLAALSHLLYNQRFDAGNARRRI